MTQKELTELQNRARLLAEQDKTNDYNTILDSLIEEYESGEKNFIYWK